MKNLGAVLFAAIFFLGLAIVYAANAGEFIEGKHYQKMSGDVAENEVVKELMSQTPGKVQVLEFFSYGCHWCFKLDPYMEKWRKTEPANIDFQRIPVEFHPTWGNLTKSYYMLVDLKALDKAHSAFFDAVQTERISNTGEDSLKQFFSGTGIPEKDFTNTFNSFDVTRKQKWANAIARAYKITAIPVIIVQGPKGVYMTAVRLAGSEDNVVKVVNELVEMQNKSLVATPKSALKSEKQSTKSTQ
jgi:thiol:disulfide interchange protein DsbA